jgi:hypothetical protein
VGNEKIAFSWNLRGGARTQGHRRARKEISWHGAALIGTRQPAKAIFGFDASGHPVSGLPARSRARHHHLHDLHATILHQMGLDHEKLTYRHGGRDWRLTDVHGHVVKAVLA